MSSLAHSRIAPTVDDQEDVISPTDYNIQQQNQNKHSFSERVQNVKHMLTRQPSLRGVINRGLDQTRKQKERHSKTWWVQRILVSLIIMFVIVFVVWFAVSPESFYNQNDKVVDNYMRNPDGSLQLDQNGNPVLDNEVYYKKDINGRLVLDGHGNPIVIQKYHVTHATPNALNGFYYACTTLSSTGYGDIVPLTPNAKGFAAFVQIVMIMISVGLFWNITDGHFSKMYNIVKDKMPYRRSTE
jgi:hypothetical protein